MEVHFIYLQQIYYYRKINPWISIFLKFLLRYVQPPVINFDAIYEQSTPFSPIVFILSPGSDPASDLMKLAERSGFGEKFQFLAMGQGQEKVTHGKAMGL